MTNITEIGRILKLQFSLLEHSCVKRSDKRQKEGKMDEIKLFDLYGGGISGACTCSTNNTQPTWKAHTEPVCTLCLGFLQ